MTQQSEDAMKEKQLMLWVRRDGSAVFRKVSPGGGALPICPVRDRKHRAALAATLRLGYDGKTLLVPGVPEAGKDEARALAAVVKWQEWALRDI